MSTDTSLKVTAQHLKRDAFLYVRQSSLRQVLENTESTQRQYALRERAVALGWPIERIHIIDTDLGRSGAQTQGRDGFQHLVSEVAMGHAGIVLGLEVSRLARNNADWHRLLELSGLTGTLILDEDGLYDPSQFNDRLLLGLKGAMSEAELHILKARLQGGMRNKARRGELVLPLPIGFAYSPLGAVILDPDRQVAHALGLLFETFKQTGSGMAVVRRFRNEKLLFPRRIRRGIGKGDLHWATLVHSRVLQILHNPRYAGAYVYGRTRTARTPELKTTALRVAREEWQVLIHDAHPGYLSWEEFEANQRRLADNAASFSMQARGSLPREGAALLQGRLICGRCGARMRVRYDYTEDRLVPHYFCSEVAVRQAGKSCQSVVGTSIDAAISVLLLETVAPAAIELALAVQGEIAERIQQADTLREQQLERARYDAELARRRYLSVDPANRLVADALEADWNDKLRQLDQLQQVCNQQRHSDNQVLTEEAHRRIVALAQDFPAVWNDPKTPALERKRMVALLIEDVTLIKGDVVTLHIRFRGGKTDTLHLPRPRPIALIRKTLPEVVQAIDALLETGSDREVATALNQAGHKNWKGDRFTAKKVAFVRNVYQLKSRFERLRDRGMLTGNELAIRLGVCTTTIHQWGREGVLQRHLYGNKHRCLYEPILNVRLEKKGVGGRRAKPPIFTTVSST